MPMPTMSGFCRAYYDRKSNGNVVIVEDLLCGHLALCRKCNTAQNFGLILQTAIDESVEKFCIEHRHETCRWTWDLVKKVYL